VGSKKNVGLKLLGGEKATGKKRKNTRKVNLGMDGKGII